MSLLGKSNFLGIMKEYCTSWVYGVKFEGRDNLKHNREVPNEVYGIGLS
jgi:hypothetical protein